MKVRSLECWFYYCLPCLAVFLLILMYISESSIAEPNQQVPLSAEEILHCKPGFQVPSIVLQLPDKSEFDLNKAIKQSPIVLIFYRGGW
ncbi:MAG: hypothetical protein ACUZ8O_12400 [Candidatus Anammoxibacter sp.]